MLVLKKNNEGTPRVVEYLDQLVRPGRRPPKQKYEHNTKPASVPYGDHSFFHRRLGVRVEARTCAASVYQLPRLTLVA